MKFLALTVMMLLCIFAIKADASLSKFLFPAGFNQEKAGIQKRAAPSLSSAPGGGTSFIPTLPDPNTTEQEKDGIYYFSELDATVLVC